MATATVDLVEELNDLIQLDFDAIEAYKASIDRLENPMFKERLRAFMADHQRHTRELSQHVRALGGTPPNKGDMKRVLTKGKVIIGNLTGDKGILQAMKSNENQTNEQYEQSLRMTDIPVDIRTTLERNLGDERRHRAWIVEQLARL